MAMVQDPAAVYALGSSPQESARLRRQSRELTPESAALLDRIELAQGAAAIDLGCGPSGILDLLSAAVGPSGRVVGVDADAGHVRMARELTGGLGNVEVLRGDARATGLPGEAFGLVHCRTLLVTVPRPGEVLAEMVRLARPGGWVAAAEPDMGVSVCYPAHPAWDRLAELFHASFGRSGADLLTGRRLTELLRQAGLDDVGVTAFAGTYPAGHTRRTLLPDLVHNLAGAITGLGLASEQELASLDREARAHLADPQVVVMPHLLFAAWGRKPA